MGVCLDFDCGIVIEIFDYGDFIEFDIGNFFDWGKVFCSKKLVDYFVDVEGIYE